MVLKSLEGLRAFCEELSSDSPSPGGGSASAAGGAIAASLLSMVCAISIRSRSCSESWPMLRELKVAMDEAVGDLLALAERDAAAYERLVTASRDLRAAGTDRESESRYRKALTDATETPMSTAERCLRVLKAAAEVGRLGTRNAWSDVSVAAALAYAGVRGGLANVRINLEQATDHSYSDKLRARAEELLQEAEEAKKLAEGAL